MAAVNATALTTLDELKGELGIALIDTTYDSRLGRLINVASSVICKYLSRELARAEVLDERHAVDGGIELVINRPPLNEITEITLEDATDAFAVDSYLVKHAGAGVIYFRSGLPRYGFRRPGIAGDLQPGTESPDLLVSYDGGYITPAQAEEVGGTYEGEDVTLPPEIEQACLQLAALYYETPVGSPGEVQSEAIGDASITYRAAPSGDDDGLGIPNSVRGLINKYKRVFVI